MNSSHFYVGGRRAVAAAAALCVAAPGLAQDAAPAAVETAATPAAPADPCAAALAAGRKGTCIPALTPVVLELLDPVSSRTAVTGEHFKLALARPIAIEGKDAAPEGAPGDGEVVHAKKTGIGVGGELVLAARYIEVGGTKIRLRSMKLTGRGKDQEALTFATAVTLGLPALFIRGKHVDVPVGAIADAKTAEAAWIDTPDAPVPQPAPSASPPEGGNAQ